MAELFPAFHAEGSGFDNNQPLNPGLNTGCGGTWNMRSKRVRLTLNTTDTDTQDRYRDISSTAGHSTMNGIRRFWMDISISAPTGSAGIEHEKVAWS